MFLCVKDLYLISHLDVLDDCVLLMFPGHGELREPDLLTTVPLAVVPQDLNGVLSRDPLSIAVPMCGQVVEPAAQQLALHHELVEPLGVEVAGGGADQLPVRVLGLHLHPGQGRLQGAQVGLVGLVGLVEPEDRLERDLSLRASTLSPEFKFSPILLIPGIVEGRPRLSHC